MRAHPLSQGLHRIALFTDALRAGLTAMIAGLAPVAIGILGNRSRPQLARSPAAPRAQAEAALRSRPSSRPTSVA